MRLYRDDACRRKLCRQRQRGQTDVRTEIDDDLRRTAYPLRLHMIDLIIEHFVEDEHIAAGVAQAQGWTQRTDLHRGLDEPWLLTIALVEVKH